MQTSKQLNELVASHFGVAMASSVQKTVNRAVRTLPGGAETLDAIESLNAARNHAHRHQAHDRIVVIDAAIDRVEQIRTAMERHVIETVGGTYR